MATSVFQLEHTAYALQAMTINRKYGEYYERVNEVYNKDRCFTHKYKPAPGLHETAVLSGECC